jgi:hypothetical protein
MHFYSFPYFALCSWREQLSYSLKCLFEKVYQTFNCFILFYYPQNLKEVFAIEMSSILYLIYSLLLWLKPNDNLALLRF